MDLPKRTEQVIDQLVSDPIHFRSNVAIMTDDDLQTFIMVGEAILNQTPPAHNRTRVGEMMKMMERELQRRNIQR